MDKPDVTRLLRAHYLALLLVAALVAACAATPNRESTGAYIDDAAITTKVKAAIATDPNLSALQIKVGTYEGVVQLSGFVDSQEAVQKAQELASGIPGVKSVVNNLIVKRHVAG